MYVQRQVGAQRAKYLTVVMVEVDSEKSSRRNRPLSQTWKDSTGSPREDKGMICTQA